MYRQYQYTVEKRPSHTLRNILLLIAATGIVIAGYTVTHTNKTEAAGDLINPFISSENTQDVNTNTRIKASTNIKRIDMSLLKLEIEEIIKAQTPEGKNWIFGVVVTDLATNDQININETEQFDAASVGKIPILLTLYDQIKQGIIKETDTITIQDADIQDYGTGTLRYKKMPMTLTIRELADLMIKQSDNTAAYVLADKVGRSQIKNFVASLNMSNTDTAENTTTPQDTNAMLVYTYNLKNTDPRTAGTLMNIMTKSAFEQRLPGQLPPDTIIAHKIGTGTAQIHDVGIVLLEDRPYTISVFSKQINDEKQAENIIALISKKTFDTISAVK